MSVKYLTQPYTQADGTTVSFCVADTEAERPSSSPGGYCFTKDTNKVWASNASSSWQEVGGSGASLPAGVIVMWSGTLATVPSGWSLCDGQAGTPDLRDRFIMGWTNAVNPGGTGGATTHAHADHAAQSHSAHAGTAVAAHNVTQPSAHSAHVVTQPSAHSALGNHAHELPFQKVAGGTGVLRMLAASVFGTGTSRAAESQSAAPVANTTSAAVVLSQAVTGGTPSAHAGTAVDAHSAHSGTAVDAHGVTQPSAHTDHAALSHGTGDHTPSYFKLAFIIKT